MLTDRDVLTHVNVILDTYTDNPAQEIRRLGEALMKIGDCFEEVGIDEARRILQAVALLRGIKI